MKKIIAIALAVFSVLAVSAGIAADSVTVYFRAGHSRFDPSLGDNGAAMNSFIARLCCAGDSVERVVVRAYASPDGLQNANKRLALNRCNTIAQYIIKNADIASDIVDIESGGVAWELLKRAVEDNPAVPSREKILYILDNVPLNVFDADGRIVDGRKKQLMDLDRGNTYRWLMEHIFPELRKAVAISVYLKEPSAATSYKASAGAGAIDSMSHVVATDTISHVDTSMYETQNATETGDSLLAASYNDYYTNRDAASMSGASRESYHIFALKNNIIFDAALMPNLEFEWLINNTWSVALEGGAAWWKNDPKHKYYQLAYASPEVRYHIRNRAPWHGMYVGAFVGGGYYDLENGGKGYRGEGAMAGMSFGYMWPISKHFSLEAGIGVGYLYSRYKEYEPREGHYLYMRTKHLNYVGPLKLKFAIAWRFGASNKPFKNIPAL
ncbi:MAG: DUF3575 domain-containing protein [Muribaculaceae bacterium]|nr:DUF3575 domain-containing protein [Muribaculaceae bacterium]